MTAMFDDPGEVILNGGIVAVSLRWIRSLVNSICLRWSFVNRVRFAGFPTSFGFALPRVDISEPPARSGVGSSCQNLLPGSNDEVVLTGSHAYSTPFPNAISSIETSQLSLAPSPLLFPAPWN